MSDPQQIKDEPVEETFISHLVELRDRVAIRPNIKAYLSSERRIAFNEDGIFRRYKALDV